MTPAPHKHEVTVWPSADAIGTEDGGMVFEDVDWVSLVNGGTHGPPALVAPGRANGTQVATRAQVGQEVLYINTALVPLFAIKRVS